LQPGDTIMAIGRATVEVDPAGRAPTHREPPMICRLEGADEPVLIADADVTRAPERYAARFAAKEATLKAFRPMPHDAVDPRSIEVRQLPEGACDIVLHDGAIALARRSGIVELSLSMSHEQEYATATVVACVAPLGATTRWPGPVNGTESVEETRSTSTSWDA